MQPKPQPAAPTVAAMGKDTTIASLDVPISSIYYYFNKMKMRSNNGVELQRIFLPQISEICKYSLIFGFRLVFAGNYRHDTIVFVLSWRCYTI